MSCSSFLSGRFDAGPPLGHEDGVGHRHIRGHVAVEHELRFDRPLVHRRRGLPRPRAKNSVNASATRAEIVLPDSLARTRTAAARTVGNLTVNTVVVSGTDARPPTAARSA
jgi:hypothetical protein